MAENSVQKARANKARVNKDSLEIHHYDKDSLEIHRYEQESPLPSAKELEDYQRVAPDLIPFFIDLARKGARS